MWDVGDLLEPFAGSVAVGVARVFAGGPTGFWAIDK